MVKVYAVLLFTPYYQSLGRVEEFAPWLRKILCWSSGANKVLMSSLERHLTLVHPLLGKSVWTVTMRYKCIDNTANNWQHCQKSFLWLFINTISYDWLSLAWSSWTSSLSNMFLSWSSAFSRVSRSFSVSRNPALMMIWFSFARLASRDRFAATLFLLRLLQYLSSLLSSGTKV